MKKFLIAIASLGICSAIVTSCDSKAKLSESVQGTWTSNPERVLDSGAATASMVRVMSFTSGNTQYEGTVTLTALITVDNSMQANDSLVSPITITASGTATITGAYQIKDDDDITVNLDATSLSIAVDPDAVQLNYNIATGDSEPVMAKLKPNATVLATQQINRAAQNAFFDLTEIEDIKINNNLMSCEIGDRDLNFTRTAPAVQK